MFGFTRLDGRSVCGDPRPSASGGHLSIERMGWHAYKRHVLRTRCAKSPNVGRLLIPSGKSLETEKRPTGSKDPTPKCQVGDRVRLNKKHRPFKKGLYADTLKVSSGALTEVTLLFRYSITDREATRVLASGPQQKHAATRVRTKVRLDT